MFTPVFWYIIAVGLLIFSLIVWSIFISDAKKTGVTLAVNLFHPGRLLFATIVCPVLAIAIFLGVK